MANKFSADGSCVALWTFEGTSATFTDDKKGSNDLTNNKSAETEGVVVKEGVQSINFIAANTAYLTITDNNLDVGFPYRFNDGTSVKTDITIGTWLQLSATPVATDMHIFSKYHGGVNTRTFTLSIASSGVVIVGKGYNNGASAEFDNHGSKLDKNIQYYLSYGYEEGNKSFYIHIWDDNAGAVLGSDVEDSFIEETSVRDVLLGISWDTAPLWGYLDEYVVFNIKKSLADTDKMRAGTYDYELRYPNHGRLGMKVNRKLKL
jgi:hypothetical protein